VRRALLALVLIGAAVCAQALPAPAQTAPAAAPDSGFEMRELDSRAIPIGGALADNAQWQAWKARFLTDQGRVVDTANGNMSHSEGQGYGMLLAVAANDRVAFERIWAWTRANLAVRADDLFAWRWEPDKRPAVGDVNNATDGDMLIAWALTEASDFWGEPSYRVAARGLAIAISRKTFFLKPPWGVVMLPAIDAFADADRPDGPVVNPSYWVFPAFERLRLAAPDVNWRGLAQTGLDIVKAAHFGEKRLPPDWLSLRDKTPTIADGFPPNFGYNAIRIPLYMAWAGLGEREDYLPFVEAWREATPAIVDLKTGATLEKLTDPGYRAIGALMLCATQGKPIPADIRVFNATEHYYPATLRLMALVAARMRYPSCLDG
jgi:endoglucanase